MRRTTIDLPWTPKWSRKWIEKRLSENYFKKPYDRFMWWRSYTPKNKPLTSRHPLRDRIANGDFEQGPYLMEVELVLHTMNDKYLDAVTTNGEVDWSLYHSNTSVDRARKKRLIEDHEKEEQRKLTELRNAFTSYRWKLSKDQYDIEVEKFNGTILEFYDYIEEKYS